MFPGIQPGTQASAVVFGTGMLCTVPYGALLSLTEGIYSYYLRGYIFSDFGASSCMLHDLTGHVGMLQSCIIA